MKKPVHVRTASAADGTWQLGVDTAGTTAATYAGSDLTVRTLRSRVRDGTTDGP
jgi:hypothetical protein